MAGDFVFRLGDQVDQRARSLQVEHIIQTRTQPGEYCPSPDQNPELGPTKACVDAITCLEVHCRLLKGSTSKEVLEVFYQEVGLRLQK